MRTCTQNSWYILMPLHNLPKPTRRKEGQATCAQPGRLTVVFSLQFFYFTFMIYHNNFSTACDSYPNYTCGISILSYILLMLVECLYPVLALKLPRKHTHSFSSSGQLEIIMLFFLIEYKPAKLIFSI